MPDQEVRVSISRLAVVLGKTWRTISTRLRAANLNPVVGAGGAKLYDVVPALNACLDDDEDDLYGPALFELCNPNHPNPLRWLIEVYHEGVDDAVAEALRSWVDGVDDAGGPPWKVHGITKRTAEDIAWRLYGRIAVYLTEHMLERFERGLATRGAPGKDLDEIASVLLQGKVQSGWSTEGIKQWSPKIVKFIPAEFLSQIGGKS